MSGYLWIFFILPLIYNICLFLGGKMSNLFKICICFKTKLTLTCLLKQTIKKIYLFELLSSFIYSYSKHDLTYIIQIQVLLYSEHIATYKFLERPRNYSSDYKNKGMQRKTIEHKASSAVPSAPGLDSWFQILGNAIESFIPSP